MKTINYMAYSQVMRIPNLTLSDKLILCYFIACQKHNGNHPFVRQSTIIADNMQIHQNTIKKAIKQLRESNLIQVDRKDVNYYSINTTELRKHMTQEEFDELDLNLKVKVEVKNDMANQVQEIKENLTELSKPVNANEENLFTKLNQELNAVLNEDVNISSIKELELQNNETKIENMQEDSMRVPSLDTPDAEIFIKSMIPDVKLIEWRRNIHSHDSATRAKASSEMSETVEWINAAFYKGNRRTISNITKIIDRLIYKCYGTV